MLQHSNIARFYDCYIVDNTDYYVVIEFCPGKSLTKYLDSHILTDYESMLFCKYIAEGLAFAHQKKIVHRDLKPDNILIGKGKIPKICDFGCSKSVLTQNG